MSKIQENSTGEKGLVLLAGNHKAHTVPGGHNGGRVDSFYFQEHAFKKACETYKRALQMKIPAHLFTAIDHIGGIRVLTGKRGNSPILGLEELIPTVQNPLKEVLESEQIDETALKIIPEKTLIAHDQFLRENNLFNEDAAQRTCSVSRGVVCKGLAGAYLDLAAREALKSNQIRNLLVFIEEGAAVPTRTIYTSGASIVRQGLVEKEGYPNWTRSIQMEGFLCTEGSTQRIF